LGWATRSERLAKLRARLMQGLPFRGRLGWCLELPVRRCRRTGLPSWSRATLQCLVVGRSSGSFGSPRSPSTLGPHEPGPWSLPSSAAPRASFENTGPIHSWAFTLLQGVTRDHPSATSRSHASGFRSTVPLMGFRSLQRSRARRSRHSQRFHPLAPCVFRVRALLTPCSPSSLPVVSDEAAPGIPAFRALILPAIRRSFEPTRALLTLLVRTEPR
jgi:hypothetical protein